MSHHNEAEKGDEATFGSVRKQEPETGARARPEETTRETPGKEKPSGSTGTQSIIPEKRDDKQYNTEPQTCGQVVRQKQKKQQPTAGKAVKVERKRTAISQQHQEAGENIRAAEFTGKLVLTDQPSTSAGKTSASHPDSATSQVEQVERPQSEAGARVVKPKQYQQQKSKTSQASSVKQVQVGKQPTAVASSSSVSHAVSYRRIDRRLCSIKQLTPINKSSFKIRNGCGRFCHYKGMLYFPTNQCIDCYSKKGKFVKSLDLSKYEVDLPISVHPLTADRLLVAAGSGLHVVDTWKQGNCQHVLKGNCYDVHVSEGMVAVLVGEEEGECYRVDILQASDLKLQVSTIQITQVEPSTVLIHQDSVFVSSGISRANHHISVYSLSTGDMTSQYGQFGISRAVSELFCPLLSVCDKEGSLLVLHSGYNSLKTLTARGEWAVLLGRGEMGAPKDVVIVAKKMFVLDRDQNVHAFKITYK